MSIEEILGGENKNIEYKGMRPSNSKAYMKSVLAFANGTGGKIVFGIEDGTQRIVGISEEILFSEMDAIANAIADQCTPMIVPDIYMQTIEEKTIIVVDIAEGVQKPYYMKSQGVEAGTYICIAGTSRPADEYMIQELRFEGSRRSFDEMPCIGLEITDEDIDNLCKQMKAEAMKNTATEEERQTIKDLTVNQLLSWRIIGERNGKYYPTNAYAILTGDYRVPNTIQCGVFKGTTKAVFVDRKEYSGAAWELVEQAYQYVLRNIRMGATFKGIYRVDIYEIPLFAIRELIVNAVVHRSYIDRGNIQIALYDDRLEILSPGKLPKTQTFAGMYSGRSKIRNEALAKAFAYMNLMEKWGSGIPRVVREVQDDGLAVPRFEGGEVDLVVSVYRRDSGVTDKKAEISTVKTTQDTTQDTTQGSKRTTQGSKDTIQDIDYAVREMAVDYKGNHVIEGSSSLYITQKDYSIIKIIADNPQVTQKKMAEILGWELDLVKYYIAKLKEKGIIARIGTSQKGYWKILVEKSVWQK